MANSIKEAEEFLKNVQLTGSDVFVSDPNLNLKRDVKTSMQIISGLYSILKEDKQLQVSVFSNDERDKIFDKIRIIVQSF